MNSPATTPLLHYSIIPLLLAEEFHDITPPVDYSLLSPWLIFLGVFVLLTTIGLIVWFVAKSFRRPTPPQLPRERALALLEQIRGQITAIDPYRFSIRVSDILRRYVTEQFGLPVTRILKRYGSIAVICPRICSSNASARSRGSWGGVGRRK